MHDLHDILDTARFLNNRNDITGALLYVEQGMFIQLVEGPPDNIEKLLHKLGKDERHRSLTVIYDELIEKRWFTGWLMGFVTDTLLTHDPYTGSEISETLLRLRSGVSGGPDRNEILLLFANLYAHVTEYGYLREALPGFRG